MGWNEEYVEGYLVRRVKDAGGKAYKFLPFAEKGMPDRLIALNGLHFVETKAPKGRLSKVQEAKHRELASFGITVWVCHTRELVDDFLDVIK